MGANEAEGLDTACDRLSWSSQPQYDDQADDEDDGQNFGVEPLWLVGREECHDGGRGSMPGKQAVQVQENQHPIALPQGRTAQPPLCNLST